MGRLLYQLSHWAPQSIIFYWKDWRWSACLPLTDFTFLTAQTEGLSEWQKNLNFEFSSIWVSFLKVLGNLRLLKWNCRFWCLKDLLNSQHSWAYFHPEQRSKQQEQINTLNVISWNQWVWTVWKWFLKSQSNSFNHTLVCGYTELGLVPTGLTHLQTDVVNLVMDCWWSFQSLINDMCDSWQTKTCKNNV